MGKKTTLPVEIGGADFETVAVSQVDQVLGAVGAKNDFLARLVIETITPATASVTLTDGATAIVIQTGNAALPVGPRSVEIGIRAKTGPFKITTGAGVTVIAVGQFSDVA
jgi:hypothetical protein